jgi:ABC-type spermidine/putrescine transport system permease subunit II
MPTAERTLVVERPATRPAPRASARNRTSSTAKRTHPMWFLVPAFAILLVFFFLPTLFNFIYAFTDWSGFKASINPTGLDNFTQLASDGTLLRAVRITLQPVVTTVLVLGFIGIPLWLVLVTAAKSQGEALNPDLSLPSRWQLFENLQQVWVDGEVPAAFLGSLLVVVPTVAGVLTFGSMAAWILARRATRLNAALYASASAASCFPRRSSPWCSCCASSASRAAPSA